MKLGPLPVYYAPDEIAEALKVTRRTVYSWLHSGQLQASRAGKGWRVSQAQLDAFLAGRSPRPSRAAKSRSASEDPPAGGDSGMIEQSGASEEALKPMQARGAKKKSRRR